MSNDTKFWVARIAYWTIFSIDGCIVFKVAGDTFVSGRTPSPVWYILFVLCTILGVGVVFVYYHIKSQRWESNIVTKKQTQIEVETLAAYAAQQRAGAKATANKRVVKKV